jgi:hypothetical protein
MISHIVVDSKMKKPIENRADNISETKAITRVDTGKEYGEVIEVR